MTVPSCPVCRTRVWLDDGGVSDSVVNDDDIKFLWAIDVGRCEFKDLRFGFFYAS
ncbi:hypothetical protein Hanom_Chr07g00620991 [Helianthus anomalus]